jgi:ribonuclease R
VSISLDEQGSVASAAPAPRNEAHRLIEELMLAANEAVAEHLLSPPPPAGRAPGGRRNKGSEEQAAPPEPLFRVHPPPRESNQAEIFELCRALGVDVHAEGWDRREPWDATWLSELMARVRERPDVAVIEQLIVRSLQQARYAETCDGHYALATRYYCHFTSPIRRYPDLIVHRALRARLGLGASFGADAEHSDRADWLSRRERRAESAERELRKWKLVRYLGERVGSEWPGMITGVEDFGLFVVLDELLIDGLVPLERLPGDDYELDRSRHQLVGRHLGRRFQLGDPLRVRVEQADQRRRRIDLSVATSQKRSASPPPRVVERPLRRDRRPHGGARPGIRRR